MTQIIGRDVSLGYEGKVCAEKLYFEVNSGDYLCLVGENGAGKSTFVKAVLKLISPIHGEIMLEEGVKSEEIGYLPQHTEVQQDFPASVREIVLSGCLNNTKFRPFYTQKDKDKAMEKMCKLGIEKLANKCYRELSGGQQQRVLLARALCATKKILVLDEPASGLDPIAVHDMYALIKELNDKEKITIVMVSHDISAAVKYADKILHLGSHSSFFGTTKEYVMSDVGRRFIESNGEVAGNA